MAQVAAPSSVNYSNQLPLGIESKSHRRLFFPSTGDKYSPTGTNIARIDLNYDGMLDTSQSYLMFNLKNTSTKKIKQDLGQPLIKRLTISSGGVVLEDIQHYNQLLGGILIPSQAGFGNFHTESFNHQTHCNNAQDAPDSNPFDGTFSSQSGDATGQNATNATGIIDPGDDCQICYKLVSGLLDNDKYLPLVLCNSGLTVAVEWSPGNEIGTSAETTGADITYEVTGLRYVAHLIDLERGFYDRLRSVQQASGGQLTIAGTSFRSYTGHYDKAGNNSINIPARVRSIKSVFWKLSNISANKSSYDLSLGSHGNISSYHLKIGATNYPPTAINCNAIKNKIEPYLELQKAFGKLGSTVHSDMLGAGSYLCYEDIKAATLDCSAPVQMGFAPFGIDLEAFRHEIENGINTSERALPMSLTLNTSSAATEDLTAHIFVMYDAMFYVDMSGAVSVSS
jgi:hypothetical protein